VLATVKDAEMIAPMGSGCGTGTGVCAGGVAGGAGGAPLLELIGRISAAPQPVSTELAAIAAKPCRSWRRESVRAENFGLRVRESI
jgi:hypothetical protein